MRLSFFSELEHDSGKWVAVFDGATGDEIGVIIAESKTRGDLDDAVQAAIKNRLAEIGKADESFTFEILPP